MKSKKGFTLVELLAVLVVLALLMVLALPAVLNSSTNARKVAFQQQVRKYVETAETIYNTASIDGSIKKKVYLTSELMPDLTEYVGCVILKDNGELDKAYVYGNSYLTNGTTRKQVYGNINNNASAQVDDDRFTSVNINQDDKNAILRSCNIELSDNTSSNSDNVSSKTDDNSSVKDDTSSIISTNKYVLKSYVKDTYFWQYRSSIKKVVIANTISKPSNTSHEWDMSVDDDGSVMAYLTSDNILHIQGDGKLYANPNSNRLFLNFSVLTEISNLELLDTSKVTDMTGMFAECSVITTLDLSTFNTSNVTNMNSMFVNCPMLYTLDLSNFDTSKVTDMAYLFSQCTRLSVLKISSFDTSNVTNMYAMFNECTWLSPLDLSHFDTSKVTDMSFMFCKCTSLSWLGVTSFNTKNVKSMKAMFSNCTSLTSLDLSNFDTSSVTDVSFMFNNCSKLTTVDFRKFNSSKVKNSDYMLHEVRATFYVRNSDEVSFISRQSIADRAYASAEIRN